ncbi:MULTISPECIES: RluA family pseudouridine synthase [Mammaliicoccus]|uniref:RNA pseudouridylate synthase n=1 Tax=Mammaliicoccus vitulinus TaxID=71237 RepID=A0A2T4PSI3_9STAP|nr:MULTISPECIES: RluA family pseudouridine synthase [Mammaliicoccus]PTI29275.1 RluA family pseudouridine synthase [Mammaliicoccus vitulinus]PTI36974.1 RluA family pseudouridine synthase [Mammaliicoccus vitulinus]RIN21413.1 RluA family pseudouridine synthase [Mammaliicoccus vitulinus]
MQITIPSKYEGQTIEEMFKSLHLPKKELHLLRMSKEITINDQASALRDSLSEGDKLSIPVFNETSQYVPSYRLAEVKYEDEYLAIVVKPKGVKTHPNDLKEANTLMNHVIYTLDSDYAEPVHRLDQETVGLLLIAKHPIAKKILDHMLEDRKITRTYKAQVDSHLPLKPQTIDMPIGKDKFHPNKRRVSPTGQRAITHIIESHMIDERTAEVELKLDTGRTHQIRVHLTEIGHPVVGDPLYNNSKLRQLQLHSYKIEFEHPFKDELVSVRLDD